MFRSSATTGRRRVSRVGLAAAATGLAVAAAIHGAAGASAAVRPPSKPTPSSPSGHYGAMPLRPGNAALYAAAATDLVYHGGYIQDHPAVYLLFWGTQWSMDSNGVQPYLTNFFAGLGTASDHWSTVTSQYTGRGGHPVFGTSVLKGSWVDTSTAAPSNASDGAIAAEALKGAAHFGVSGHNVNIIVVSPQGTHPGGFPNGGFCAWHSATSGTGYTNMPYVLDAGSGCGANAVRSKLDGFSMVAGHEYLEAVSDPLPPTGWLDSSGAENADKCAWRNLHSIALATGTFAVQPTYSNQTHGCAG